MGLWSLGFFLPNKRLFTVMCQTQFWCHYIHSFKPHGIMRTVSIFSLPFYRKGNWGTRIPTGSTKHGRDAVPESALQLQTSPFISVISEHSEATIWPIWHAPLLHNELTQSFTEITMNPRASLVAQMVKNPPAMQKTWVYLWVGKIPWRKACQPIPVFLLGEFHGHGSRVGYSPWGHKELDTTEWLSTWTVNFKKNNVRRPQ